jgi:hypothetical protein
LYLFFDMEPLTLRSEILTFGHDRYQCRAEIASIGIDILGRDVGITKNGEKYLILPDKKGKYFMSGGNSSWAIIHPILLPKFLEADVEPDDNIQIEEIRSKLDYYLAIFDTISELDASTAIETVFIRDNEVFVTVTLKVRGQITLFDIFTFPNTKKYKKYEFRSQVSYHDLLGYRINQIKDKYSVKKAPLTGKIQKLPPRER